MWGMLTCFWMLPQERPWGITLLSVPGQPPRELRTSFTVSHACLGDCGPASSSCWGPIPLEHYCLSPGLLEPGIQSELRHQGTNSQGAGLSPPSFWGSISMNTHHSLSGCQDSLLPRPTSIAMFWGTCSGASHFRMSYFSL